MKAISALDLEKASYSIKGFNIKKQKTQTLDTLYFKDEAYKEPFTLNDFIRDKEAFQLLTAPLI